MRRETFERHVRNALTNLYDPASMQTHPLGELLPLRVAPGGSKGEALRDVLWEVIESLKPDDAVPLEQPAWFGYRILWLHYIQGLTVEQTCEAVGLSPRSFRRYQKRAIEAVAEVLWSRYGLVESDGPARPELPAESQDLVEARRFAHGSAHERCDLGEILQHIAETIRPLTDDLGIALRIRGPASPTVVYGDPALLAQIVLNVLTCALPAIRSTTLEISASLEEGHLVWEIGPLRPAKAQEALEHSPEMRVCRVLLEACGGRLEGPGGLTFRILIPLPEPRVILVIDDDPDTVGLYTRYLSKLYVVKQARSVEQALALLHQHRPDIVLLDVLMPHQDGWKFLRSLRADPQTSTVPVIVCSVLSQPSLALALGADRVLEKPIGREALLKAVGDLLSRQGNPLSSPPGSPPTT